MTRREKILYGAAFFLIFIAVCVQCQMGGGGDKLWLLQVAGMWLEGKKLYVDLFEVNMPLITWMDGVPVYLSKHLSFFDEYSWLGILGTLVTCVTAGVSMRLISYHRAFAEDKSKQIQFALLLLYVLIFCTNPAYFFDREHIFLVLAFPYMLFYMPSLVHVKLPLGLRFTIGVMAGIGFCMKPHTLIVLIGMQLIYILRERRFDILVRLENILIYLVGLTYLFAVWQLTPQYFKTVLPMTLLTYGATSRKPGGLIFISIALIMLGVTFVDFRRRYTSPYRKDIYYFLALCVPLLAYALFNNGWGYTYNLLLSVILFLSGWVWWEFLYLRKHQHTEGHDEPARQFLQGARACALNLAGNGLLIVVIWSMLFTSRCEDYLECRISEKFTAIVKNEEAHNFGTISISFLQWTELVNDSGAHWDTRFSQLWMLPAFFANDEAFATRNRWVLEYVANAYAQDLNQRKPDIVFVDDDDIFYSVHKHIDLIAYLSPYGAFRDAWQHYRLQRTINLCHEVRRAPGAKVGVGCQYFIYRRILDVMPANSPPPESH